MDQGSKGAFNLSVSNKVSLYREKRRQRGRKKDRDMGGRDSETEKREKSGEMKCRGQRRDAWRRGRKALKLACSGGRGCGLRWTQVSLLLSSGREDRIGAWPCPAAVTSSSRRSGALSSVLERKA